MLENPTLAILALDDRVKMAACFFDNCTSKIYHYKHMIPGLEAGDLCIVHKKDKLGEDDGPADFAVVKILDPDVEIDFNSTIRYKWLLAPFPSLDAYTDLLKMEADTVRLLRKADKRGVRERLKADLLLVLGDEAKRLPWLGDGE